jgi:hypothetical protein
LEPNPRVSRGAVVVRVSKTAGLKGMSFAEAVERFIGVDPKELEVPSPPKKRKQKRPARKASSKAKGTKRKKA